MSYQLYWPCHVGWSVHTWNIEWSPFNSLDPWKSAGTRRNCKLKSSLPVARLTSTQQTQPKGTHSKKCTHNYIYMLHHVTTYNSLRPSEAKYWYPNRHTVGHSGPITPHPKPKSGWPPSAHPTPALERRHPRHHAWRTPTCPANRDLSCTEFQCSGCWVIRFPVWFTMVHEFDEYIWMLWFMNLMTLLKKRRWFCVIWLIIGDILLGASTTSPEPATKVTVWSGNQDFKGTPNVWGQWWTTVIPYTDANAAGQLVGWAKALVAVAGS